MEISLPKKTKALVERYFNLEIGLFKIRCPYFQNIKKLRSSPVFVGKGLPEEIEKETIKLFRRSGKDLTKYHSQQLRQYMVMGGLGIDCSGFVARILDSLLKEKKLGGIRNNLHPIDNNIIDYLKYNIRTFTNLSADTLTSKKNSIEVKYYSEVLPGDLIRAGPRHVAIITEVEKKNGKTARITYCHSTYDYLEESGVHKGNIFITRPNKDLKYQKWDEFYRGRNWMQEDYLGAKAKDRGIRKLKALAS